MKLGWLADCGVAGGKRTPPVTLPVSECCGPAEEGFGWKTSLVGGRSGNKGTIELKIKTEKTLKIFSVVEKLYLGGGVTMTCLFPTLRGGAWGWRNHAHVDYLFNPSLVTST